MAVVEIPMVISLNRNDIYSLMDKAFDNGGGSLHWALGADGINSFGDDKPLIINGCDGVNHQLTLDMLINGIQLALPYIKHAVTINDLDISKLEEDTCDLILQLSLFNIVKYD